MAAWIAAPLALCAEGPHQEWPKVRSGVWQVSGRQSPAWESGHWTGSAPYCDHTEDLFSRKLEGQVVSSDPRDRCAYESVRIANSKFEITARCPIRDGPLAGTVGIIKTWVTLKGDRAFELRAEKTWSRAGGRPEIHFALEERGHWLRACPAK